MFDGMWSTGSHWRRWWIVKYQLLMGFIIVISIAACKHCRTSMATGLAGAILNRKPVHQSPPKTYERFQLQLFCTRFLNFYGILPNMLWALQLVGQDLRACDLRKCTDLLHWLVRCVCTENKKHDVSHGKWLMWGLHVSGQQNVFNHRPVWLAAKFTVTFNPPKFANNSKQERLPGCKHRNFDLPAN